MMTLAPMFAQWIIDPAARCQYERRYAQTRFSTRRPGKKATELIFQAVGGDQFT